MEPLAEFHKDEVKALGESLGLPKSLVNRHPFPGTVEYIDINRPGVYCLLIK